MVIEPLEKQYVEAVAKIHYDSLRADFLPSLGIDFLKKFYDASLESRFGLTYIYLLENKVVGFVVVSWDSSKLLKDIFFKKSFWVLTCGIKRIICDYKIFKNTIELIRDVFLSKNDDPVKGEIVIIAVDDNFRGRGIGKQLVSQAARCLLERDIKQCRTKTLLSNRAVISFYNKNFSGYVRDEFDLIGRMYVNIVFDVQKAVNDQNVGLQFKEGLYS